jgi:replicative DNA helicase
MVQRAGNGVVKKGRDAGLEAKIADRKFPQSVEAERYVLGAILLDPNIAETLLQSLQEHEFFSTRHQKIFRVVSAVYDRLTSVDPVLVRDELEKLGLAEECGGMDYLDELMLTVSSIANAEHHARTLREKSTLRSLISACTEIIQGAYDSEERAENQLDRAEHLILDIGETDGGEDFVQLETIIDQEFDRMDRERGQLSGLMTEFHDLDNMTTGLRPSELIIIAGRPSMGKTSFAMNIVSNAARQDKVVAIFSLEVAREQLVQNLLCSTARVDAQKFRKFELSETDFQQLVDAADDLRRRKVFIDDTPGLNPLTLKAKARRLHRRHKLDLIVIDYLQMMEGSGSGESRQQEVSKISRSLKGLARELQVPCVVLSQLSRGVENRESHRPRMSDLRESGAIEQDADVICLLYREEYYFPDRDELKGKAEIILAKQRNGPTGKVELGFFNQYMRFENLSSNRDSDEASSGGANW